MATEIESLLEYTLNVGASELIVSEGAASAVRLSGKVCAIPDAPAIEPGTLRSFVGSMDGESGSVLAGPWSGSRWRVRYNRTALGNAAVFRPLLEECPDFGSLGAPATMDSLLGLNSGIVVFAGPACSGKTTTASAYVSALCQSAILRVSNLSSVNELPIKTGESLLLKDSYGGVTDKLTQTLRSGSDLIWMGDFEGLPLIPILEAAEAGALVVLTVTAGNTVGALEALLADVADEERDLARNMLASVLKAVVVQRLLPGAESSIPAWEVLFGSQNVASRIRAGELFSLPSIISASASEGMLLMDDCLASLVQSGYVSKDEAGKYVSNPAVLG
ncbi:ATPase, T2SS/T4P/T4SS family [Fibrobacter sp. UWEL]|uniref:ATPase, T2SS/T4P/T4SS family n=1 Tax=Fibrobacter sp. UWEL TaxID=1896209 RepID=UPI00090ED242|nr:ATPase, T2SS/T4P/T4SS family [Fibrobacter sp. UWEL]SHL26163.1 twitching motility protein PilT [Fibrobacter sp. UWEL]